MCLNQKSLVMLAVFKVRAFRWLCFTSVRKLGLLTIIISSKYLPLLLNKLISECLGGIHSKQYTWKYKSRIKKNIKDLNMNEHMSNKTWL